MKSNNDKHIKSLLDLVQLDLDAILAYNQALDNIEEEDIRTALAGFREDHSRHVKNLSNLIVSLGGTPPDLKPDVKGFFLEGMTAVASDFGIRGALLAMAGNEVLTTSKYREALALQLPQEGKELVQENYGDEARHLGYIKDTLKRLTSEMKDDIGRNYIDPRLANKPKSQLGSHV